MGVCYWVISSRRYAVHHSAVNAVNGGISKIFNFQFSTFSLFRIFAAPFSLDSV